MRTAYYEVFQKDGQPALVKLSEVECFYKNKDYTVICFKSGCSLTIQDDYIDIREIFRKWVEECEDDKE